MPQILIQTNSNQASIFVLSFPLCSIFVLHIFIFSFPLCSRPKEYAQWSNGAWSGNTDHLYRKKRGKTSNTKGWKLFRVAPLSSPPSPPLAWKLRWMDMEGICGLFPRRFPQDLSHSWSRRRFPQETKPLSFPPVLTPESHRENN